MFTRFLIPKGPYCYTYKSSLLNKEGEVIGFKTQLCPFWKIKESKIGDSPIVYCSLTNIQEDVCLDDQVKVCMINEDEERPTRLLDILLDIIRRRRS